MLQFNLQYIFDLRGIDKPFSFLKRHGFTHAVAQSMSTGNLKSLRTNQIEKLCEILQCTPNDLLEWVPDKKSDDHQKHPLFKLKRAHSAVNIRKALKDFPVEKLDELEKVIEALKKGDK
ncbi:MAG TPA: hypothetical protein DDY13_05200 [Cytophagales bacterium]|jgi:DNA-binding Xre family transcriptional regulator|nr:hypothetical protein [Cytophagales bacterium]